jgi:inorganic pyrophosphatase
MLSDSTASGIIIAGSIIGLLWAMKYYKETMAIAPKIIAGDYNENHGLVNSEQKGHAGEPSTDEIQGRLDAISAAIQEGAQSFLVTEYKYCGIFMVLMSIILIVFLGARDEANSWPNAIFSTIAFILGSLTSILSGWIGMQIAVQANVRCTVSAFNAPGVYTDPFNSAFKAGAVMGFALCGFAIINLFILVVLYQLHFDPKDPETATTMYECIAGYGLGGSSIALFGRVGGGIYTKAADVGADIFKMDGLEEDDPKNPAVIADNVGDNVGDIAGMGADLFGSFAESSCAAMLISSSSPDLYDNWAVMCFPMLVAAAGIIVCLITSLFATQCCLVRVKEDVEQSLKRQLLISTGLMTPVIFLLSYTAFPATFVVSSATGCKNWYVFFCVGMGLWSGLVIGLVTNYYTSATDEPTIELANASGGRGGAAANIIYGLALGYKSAIVPCFCLAATIYVCFNLCAMYGVACGAIGILSTLSIGLTIDAYGPICDNAGGIAEMAEMPKSVRDVTDALDAAGNTTAAIGKGFAIGSAAMVSLALFGAFVNTFQSTEAETAIVVDILEPWVFAGLLIGAMLPYWFSAMTMKSVGEAANEMANEVERQFKPISEGGLDLLNTYPETQPEYAKCVAISTEASLKEMIPPGALVMITPLICGFFFSVRCLAGLLVGALISGVQMAISASNSGGAWDNAKKYVEAKKTPEGKSYKHTDWHTACVIGDTVGDPMKDTSGPSLNILIKLTAITSLVFAPAMAKNWDDKGLIQKLFG